MRLSRAVIHKTAGRHHASRIIVRFLINSCWHVFRYSLAAVVLLALGVAGYLYFQFDEELRRTVEGELAARYPNHVVTIGNAKLTGGHQVSLFNIEVAERRGEGATAPLIEIGELRVQGDFEVGNLLSGDTPLHQVELRRPRLFATRGVDGSWNYESLLTQPSSDPDLPKINISDATVVVRQEASFGNAKSITIQNISASVEANHTNGAATPGTHSFRLAVEDPLVKSFSVEGDYSPSTGAAHATLSLGGLRVTNELLASLPGVNALMLTGLQLDVRIGGKGSITIPAAGQPANWNGDLRVSDGRIAHPLLPLPISDLTINASLSNDLLQVDKLTADIAGARLSIAGIRRGWSADASGSVTWRLTGLTLDEKLYYVMPSMLQKVWNRFRPRGVIDSTGSAEFDGLRVTPDATLTCRGVSFEDHEQFPYRLTDATGALRYRDVDPSTGHGVLSVNLVGYGEGRPINITAEFNGLPCNKKGMAKADMAPCPLGWVQIEADSLQVTEKLLTALPSQAEKVARSLNPTGEFAAVWRLERPTAKDRPQTSLRLTSIDCSAQFDGFPYPLRHVRGELHERNGRWWFENLTAQSLGGQTITATGVLEKLPPSSTQAVQPGKTPRRFRMRLGGAAVVLDDTLRSALPPDAQQAWNELRPRGKIDFAADVFSQNNEKPRVDLVLTSHQRDLSVEPRSFPYRLEGIDGRFLMVNGELKFDAARAHHGRTQIEASGSWKRSPASGWRLDLTSLAVDRLDADHDFRLAAPIELRRVISRLDPRGRFGVHNGRLTIIKPANPAAPIASEWDMEFDFHQADLRGGLQIEDASGSVRLAGQSDQGKTFAVGELRVDTMFWNGLQLTNARGPLWCDKKQCLLGAAATGKQGGGVAPRQVTAELYGGSAGLNAQIIFDEQPRYGAALAFRNIDLERFTSDYAHAKKPVAGKMDGSLELQGLGLTVFGLGGTGEVHLREADFGDPTVLVSLLKVLRTRAPGTTAFDRCDARFRLQGEHISFDQLDLFGDAINLYGRGEARIDRSLDLSFRTVVGQSESSVPILRAFVGQASEQLLTIDVDGTLDAPDVQPKTLPLVGNVLRQFQQNQSAGAPTTPPARRY